MKLPSTWKVWNEHIGLYAHILYIHTIAIVIEKKNAHVLQSSYIQASTSLDDKL